MYSYLALAVLVSSFTCVIYRKFSTIFYISSIIYPIYVTYLLIINTENTIINLYNKLFLSISDENRLIGLAFMIVTMVTNLYAISQKRKLEILIGSIYSFFSLISLFAGDFISLFIALEIMMILSTILIFYGHHKNSIISSRQYFLTHLISSSLILIGISYIITKQGNLQIIPLTALIESNYKIFYLLLAGGFLINVATPPFAGWMVNCYPQASTSGIIYLTSFTSKVSIIIILKLFSGLEILKFFGVIMILYSGIYACLEDNIKRIICYLTISHLGFTLIAIGSKIQTEAFAIILLLFVDILYKALFTLYVAILIDKERIENCSEIKIIGSIKNPLLFTSLLLSILLIISFPPFSSFTTKSFVIATLNKDISYFSILFSKIITCVAVFSMIKHKNIITNIPYKLSLLGKISLSTSLFITLIISLWLEKTCHLLKLPYPLTIMNINWLDIITQLQIILVALLFTVVFNRLISKYSTFNKNIDLFHIAEKFFRNIYFKYHEQLLGAEEHSYIKEEYNILKATEKKVFRKISSLHNQQLSIFIVITLLIVFTILLFLSFSNKIY